MTNELRDPNLPPGEIVEKRHDDTWVRNDGVLLCPATESPYYVMATVFGDYFDIDEEEELFEKNRRLWNRWIYSEFDQSARSIAAKTVGIPIEEFRPLTRDETGLIQKALEERVRDSEIIPDGRAVNFAGLYFSDQAVWEGYIFPVAIFAHTYFSTVADFERCYFGAEADFDEAHFSSLASFDGAVFDSYAAFSSSYFADAALFSNGKFSARTFFHGAVFRSAVPEFFQRNFFDYTTFSAAKHHWPQVASEPQQKLILRMQHGAQIDKDAYHRLRQVSAAQHNPENEHFFLRQEMACDATLKTGLSRWIIQGFGLISDYGYSLWRPAFGLLGTVVTGALLILTCFAWSYVDGVPPEGMESVPGMFDAIGLGLANTFSIFGFRTYYLGEAYMVSLPVVVKIISGLQTVLGFVFLFFLGLGLRNRFRLK